MKKVFAVLLAVSIMLTAIIGGGAVAEEQNIGRWLPLGFVWYFDELLKGFYSSMAGDNVDEEAIAEQTEYMGLDVDSMRKEEGNFIYSSPSGMYEVTANMNEDGSLVASYEIAISLGEEYSVNGKANDTRADIVGAFMTTCLLIADSTDDHLDTWAWWMGGKCPTNDYVGESYSIKHELDESGLSHFIFSFSE